VLGTTGAQGHNSSITRALPQRKIRIGIPGDEPPYLVTMGENETSQGPLTFWPDGSIVLPTSRGPVRNTFRRDGSIVRFAQSIFEKFGLDWEQVPISEESSKAYNASTFDACMHDVSLNNTDICVGSVWPFEFRRQISSFTTSISTLGLRLVVKKKNEGSLSFKERLKQPFKPFSSALWLALIAALVYAGYAAYILDASGYVRGCGLNEQKRWQSIGEAHDCVCLPGPYDSSCIKDVRRGSMLSPAAC